MDDVDGNYYQDREVRVNGTITIPNDWVSGDYVLLIEAYDSSGNSTLVNRGWQEIENTSRS